VPNVPVPEGFRVEIEFAEGQLPVTDEEQAEFDEWDGASVGSIQEAERLAEELENDEQRRNPAG